MTDMAHIIETLHRRVAELERRNACRNRTGVIAEVDPARGKARVRLLDGDRPFLTGWIPWEEAAAGANKTHNPPSVGQQVSIASESGDLEDATIRGSLNSGANARPSGAGDEFILAQVGQASVKISGGGSRMEFQVGPSKVTLSPDGIDISGPQVKLN